jgi:hypothetical protein
MFDENILRKLEDRQGQLLKIFMEESDISKWPNYDNRTDRADRYWMKKNAAQTATLIVKIQSFLQMHLGRPQVIPPAPGSDEEIDEKALEAAATHEANKILQKVGKKLKEAGA